MPLSILMFCPQFRPMVGGAERQAEKLAMALVRQGCKVKILTPQLDSTSPQTEQLDGVLVERFALFNIKKKLPWIRGAGLFNLAIMNMQTRKIVAKHAAQADIVHTHVASPLTAFAMNAAIAARKPALCKVAMAGPMNDFARVQGIGLGGKAIATQLKKNMPCWVATTEAVEQTLLDLNIDSNKIARIPNGVELPPVREDHTDAARFLYLGRLSTDIERDVPTLIKAFDRLADDFSDAELAIVGGGDLFAATQLLAERAKNAPRIKMLGEQSPDQWLTWANCYVQPSRREGLSNALLEAMSSGLACIANDIPANNEVLGGGEFGFLTAIGDCDDLYRAMRALAAEQNVRKHWGQLARARAESTYSIDAVAKQYIGLYQKMISGNIR